MPITTALELMELRGYQGAERERAVIGRQARHLVRLVDDLLDVTRITRGRVTLQKRPLELSGVLLRAQETAQPAVERGGHALVVNVDAAGLRVYGDEDRLVQVFANLLHNAAKYTPRGGHIAVVATGDGADVVVDVIDDGKGMGSELVPRVFDLFVQGPRTIDRAEGGLGLGLAIVKSLVEMHGGSVSAHSDGVGKGSRFSARLPRIDAVAPAVRAAVAVAPRPRRNVLVVDDNEDVAGELKEALVALGQDVVVAHDGVAALAAVDDFRPALCLLDVGLPLMDGYELCERLKASLGGGVRVVAITGYGQPGDRDRAFAAGFDDHRVKPVSVAALAVLLDEAASVVDAAVENDVDR